MTAYPDWLLAVVAPGQRYADDAALMQRAIAAGLANIAHTAGGPFGAVIADDGGRVVAIGTNAVVPSHDSTAHAELLAIRRAEAARGTYTLRTPGLTLYASCAPCLMCTGAIYWAGVPRVVAAARAGDAEALGFMEGPPGFDAGSTLRQRGILYVADCLGDDAVALLRRYRGIVYNG